MGPQEGVSAGGPINLDDANAPVMPAFGSHADDLKTWMRRGFAFTLPLMGTVIVAIVLIRLMF